MEFISEFITNIYQALNSKGRQPLILVERYRQISVQYRQCPNDLRSYSTISINVIDFRRSRRATFVNSSDNTGTFNSFIPDYSKKKMIPNEYLLAKMTL